ncbi:MAG: hypothetical protein ACOVNL_01895 [Prochlorococcaceae cyanobacterium]|jgi:hypothetical protein
MTTSDPSTQEIETTDIESVEYKKQFLHEATRLAIEFVEKGWGGPFGAVIVKDGRIIGRGQNRVLLTGIPSITPRSPPSSMPAPGSTPRRCWGRRCMRAISG